MLQATLRSGAAHRRSVFELFPRRLPEGRRYGVVAGTGRFLDALAGFRFGEEQLAFLEDERHRRRPDAGVPRRLPLQRRRLGLRRGRDLLPLLPLADRRVDLRRGGAAGDPGAVDLQPRRRDRLGCFADDLGRRRPAVHRDGQSAYPRAGGGGDRAGGVHRRLRLHLQPGRGARVRRSLPRHQRALVHPGARHRGRRLPGAGRVARAGHHAAGRHLRHRRGGPPRRRGGRTRAGRRTHRLRRPGRARQAGAPSSSTSSVPRTPGSW